MQNTCAELKVGMAAREAGLGMNQAWKRSEEWAWDEMGTAGRDWQNRKRSSGEMKGKAWRLPMLFEDIKTNRVHLILCKLPDSSRADLP